MINPLSTHYWPPFWGKTPLLAQPAQPLTHNLDEFAGFTVVKNHPQHQSRVRCKKTHDELMNPCCSRVLWCFCCLSCHFSTFLPGSSGVFPTFFPAFQLSIACWEGGAAVTEAVYGKAELLWRLLRSDVPSGFHCTGAMDISGWKRVIQ